MNSNQLMTLSLDKNIASKDMLIICTVDIYNPSSTEVYKDFILSYTLPEQLTTISNSVMIDGVVVEGVDIVSGIYISEIYGNEPKQIKFQLKVSKDISADLTIKMQGDFFLYNDQDGWVRNQVFTNDENLIIIGIKLESSQVIARETNSDGELSTYTISIKNTGDTSIEHVIFRDTIVESSEFVADTFEIDGNKINGADLNKGIYIGRIEGNQRRELVYQVQQYGNKWMKNTHNNPSISYMYQVGNHSLQSRIEAIKGVKEAIGEEINPITHYKQVERIIKLEEDDLSIERINQSTGTVEISNYEEIETPIRVKGVIEKGYKLVIRGVVKLMIDYTVEVPENSVDIIQIELPFTTFVLLPGDHSLCAQIQFKADLLRNDVVVVDSKTLEIKTLSKMTIKIINLS